MEIQPTVNKIYTKKEIESIIDILCSKFLDNQILAETIIETSNFSIAERLLFTKISRAMYKKNLQLIELYCGGVPSFKRIFYLAHDKSLITDRFKILFKAVYEIQFGAEFIRSAKSNTNTSVWNNLIEFSNFLKEL